MAGCSLSLRIHRRAGEKVGVGRRCTMDGELGVKTREEMYNGWLIRYSIVCMNTAGKSTHLFCAEHFPLFIVKAGAL